MARKNELMLELFDLRDSLHERGEIIGYFDNEVAAYEAAEMELRMWRRIRITRGGKFLVTYSVVSLPGSGSEMRQTFAAEYDPAARPFAAQAEKLAELAQALKSGSPGERKLLAAFVEKLKAMRPSDSERACLRGLFRRDTLLWCRNALKLSGAAYLRALRKELDGAVNFELWHSGALEEKALRKRGYFAQTYGKAYAKMLKGRKVA